MVNVYTAGGDGQVHGAADSSKDLQHAARSSMRVDSQDHKDQADAETAAAGCAGSSSDSLRNASRDRLLPVDAGRTKSPCKLGADAPAGAAAAPTDQGAVAAAAGGLQELSDAAAVAALPASQQQQQAWQDSSTSTVSPSQQRPRGWLAMLPSPTQDDHDTSNVFAADARERTASPSSSIHHPAAQAAAGGTPEQTTAAATQQPGSSSSSGASTGVRAPRPAPLLVGGCDTPPRSGLPSSSRFSQGFGSGSPQQQPGSAGHATANRPPSGLQNRPAALQIHQPPSPLGGGCLTPSGLLSPNAMARPYSGPPLSVEDLDLDAIDGVSNDGGTGGSNSASSSPMVNAVLRSGGLRSSRDHGDLRRTALMNQMLSPRPNMALSAPSSGPPSLFTGETRALRVAPLPGSGGSTPIGAAGAAGEGEAAGSQTAASFNSTAEHVQHLLTSNVRNVRSVSSGSAASPVAAAVGSMYGGSSSVGSILDRPVRSNPGTPASRYNVAAAMGAAAGSSSTASCAPPSSSRSSSMTASPVVPPPSHGAAAALLSGSVVPSPRTPRSPLSAMLSPYLPGSANAAAQLSNGGTPTALPPPLFGAGVSLVPAACAELGSEAVQQQPGSARGSFMSPAGSRLSAASPTAAGLTAALQQQQQQQQQHGYTDQQQQQQEGQDAASTAAINLDGASATVPAQPVTRRSWQQQPEHLPQLLRQQLQLHDTRLGPHGESPLSPSHHSALLQQQHRGEGGLRSSPTRPTSLVPPALAAAAAAAHAVRRADAAAGAAAAADEAAAAAFSEVEDVGPRDDVHEWLDQHSWRFSYELPMHLRDAAEFARDSSNSSSSGHGLVSIIAPQHVVSVTAAGPFAGSPLRVGSSSDGGRHDSTAEGVEYRHHQQQQQQQLAGSIDGNAAEHDEEFVQLQELGDLAVRLERFRPRAAADRSQQADGAQGLAPCDHGSCRQAQATDAGVVSAAAADARTRSIDQDCSHALLGSSSCTAGSSSDSECCTAARGSSFQVLATSRAEAASAAPAPATVASCHVLAPGYATAAQGPGSAVAAAAALSSSSTTAAAEAQQQQQQQREACDGACVGTSSNSNRLGRPGSSSSTRLLSPGSHRYSAGSPIAADCCCCTCSPAPLPLAASTAATAVQDLQAAVDAGSVGGNDSSSRSSVAAAADKGWPDVPVAVEEAGVQLSPDRGWQQQLHEGMVPAAALHVQGQQPQRQGVLLQQPQAEQAAQLAAATPVIGCFDSSGAAEVAPSCSLAAAAAAAAAAAGVPVGDGRSWEYGDGGKKPSVKVLMRDSGYVLQLLSSLPGVDAGSPHVRLVVRELQGSGSPT